MSTYSTLIGNGAGTWCGVPYNRAVTRFRLSSGYQLEPPPPPLGATSYSLTYIYEGFVATAQFMNIGDAGCEYQTPTAVGGYVYYAKTTTSWSSSWPPFSMPNIVVTKRFSIIKNTRITQCNELGFTMEGTLHPLTLLYGTGGPLGAGVGFPTTPSPFFDPFKVFYRGTCPDAPSFGGGFRAFCERE